MNNNISYSKWVYERHFLWCCFRFGAARGTVHRQQMQTTKKEHACRWLVQKVGYTTTATTELYCAVLFRIVLCCTCVD